MQPTTPAQVITGAEQSVSTRLSGTHEAYKLRLIHLLLAIPLEAASAAGEIAAGMDEPHHETTLFWLTGKS